MQQVVAAFAELDEEVNLTMPVSTVTMEPVLFLSSDAKIGI